ncbi:hypothetical protein [Nonomuraea recticatena]|uniref:hypothetical protein n=1 Tax=Nonomuraea recticatena TaxID=46178 RepID=UPI0031F9849E
MRSSLPARSALAAVVVAALTSAPAAAESRLDPSPTATAAPWTKEFAYADDRITESSGLYASRLHDGVVWTHNDGAGPPTLYAVGRDGRTRAAISIKGAEAVDTEAMGGAVDVRGNSMLYLADIGDNEGSRSGGVTVLAVPEPTVLADGEVSAQRYQLVYPDGAHDAESILVHPQTGNLYLITKGPSGGAIYGAPSALVPDVNNRLEHLGPLPHVVSDGALNADGLMFIRGYNKIRVFADITGKLLETIPAPQQPQGESLAISADGRSLLAGSEGKGSSVFSLPLPESLVATPANTPGPMTSAPAAQESEPGGSDLPLAWLAGAGALLLLLVGAGAASSAVRRRRERHSPSADVIALPSQRDR